MTETDRCFFHLDKKASRICVGCRKPMCKACAQVVDGKTYCRSCQSLLCQSRTEATPAAGQDGWYTVSCCQCGAPRTRHITLKKFSGFFLFHQTKTTSGYFCQSCGDTQSRNHFWHNMILGWWGFPWGLFNFVHVYQTMQTWREFRHLSVAVVTSIILLLILMPAGVVWLMISGQMVAGNVQKATKLNNNALAFIEDGNYRIGLPMLENAHHLNPDNEVILSNLGYCCAQVEDYTQAAIWFEKRLARGWDKRDAVAWLNTLYINGDVDRLEEVLSQHRPNEFEGSTTWRLYKGITLTIREQYEQAAEYLSAVHTEEPNTLSAYELAKCQCHCDRYQDAEKILRPFAADDEYNRGLYIEILFAMQEAQQHQELSQAINGLITLRPDAYWAHLCWLEFQQMTPREVDQLYSTLTSQHPPENLSLLAFSRAIALQNWSAAFQALDRNSDENILPREAWMELAERAHDHDRPIALRAVAKYVPGSFLDQRAIIFLKCHARTPEHAGEILQLIESIPTIYDNVELRNLRAELLTRSGHPAEARRLMEKTLQAFAEGSSVELFWTLHHMFIDGLNQGKMTAARDYLTRMEALDHAHDDHLLHVTAFQSRMLFLIWNDELSTAKELASSRCESTDMTERYTAVWLLTALHLGRDQRDEARRDCATLQELPLAYFDLPDAYFETWDESLLTGLSPAIRHYLTGLRHCLTGNDREAGRCFEKCAASGDWEYRITTCLAKWLARRLAANPRRAAA